MCKIILQVGLAIVSALNVAVPLILDAKSIFPTWSWQYHALIGFVIFIIIMVWMVIDRQLKINEQRAGVPNVTLGNSTRVFTNLQQDGLSEIELRIRYRNIGNKPAYNICNKLPTTLRSGY